LDRADQRVAAEAMDEDPPGLPPLVFTAFSCSRSRDDRLVGPLWRRRDISRGGITADIMGEFSRE
jgi:hypothetical protein